MLFRSIVRKHDWSGENENRRHTIFQYPHSRNFETIEKKRKKDNGSQGNDFLGLNKTLLFLIHPKSAKGTQKKKLTNQASLVHQLLGNAADVDAGATEALEKGVEVVLDMCLNFFSAPEGILTLAHAHNNATHPMMCPGERERQSRERQRARQAQQQPCMCLEEGRESRKLEGVALASAHEPPNPTKNTQTHTHTHTHTHL